MISFFSTKQILQNNFHHYPLIPFHLFHSRVGIAMSAKIVREEVENASDVSSELMPKSKSSPNKKMKRKRPALPDVTNSAEERDIESSYLKRQKVPGPEVKLEEEPKKMAGAQTDGSGGEDSPLTPMRIYSDEVHPEEASEHGAKVSDRSGNEKLDNLPKPTVTSVTWTEHTGCLNPEACAGLLEDVQIHIDSYFGSDEEWEVEVPICTCMYEDRFEGVIFY